MQRLFILIRVIGMKNKIKKYFKFMENGRFNKLKPFYTNLKAFIKI